MKCLQASLRDGRISAAIADVPPPVPGADEVLVRVHASGVNRADLSQIAGRYPPPPGESAILGLEVSGRVVGTGERVCALLGGGGHAELVAVPAGQIMPVPKSVDLMSAAGIPEVFLTAFVTLIHEGRLRPGERVLIHAGASGVGLAAIQLAKMIGATVGATTRTRSKLGAMRDAGADLGFVSGEVDPVEGIEQAWGPGAVHVILDPIGAATLAGDLRLLAPRGRLIVIATMSGARTELDLSTLMKKRARIIGSTLRARGRSEKAGLVKRFQELVWQGFDTGALRVHIDSIVTPEGAGEAFQRLEQNLNVGKVLIRWENETVK